MASKRRGQDFESTIGKDFPEYEGLGLAVLGFMPTPMAPCGVHPVRKHIIYRPKSKPPFDVYGYHLTTGIFIGAELKESKRAASIPIVGEKKKGNGVQFHQLDALTKLALNSGIAKLVWNNGGEVGVLHESEIINAWNGFIHAARSEESGKQPERGAKSIQWSMFRVAKIVEGKTRNFVDWLDLTKK